MKTQDITSITNSVMQAMEKEFRKNDMAGSFHRLAQSHRLMVQAMVAITVAEHQASDERTKPEQLISKGTLR